MMAIQIVEGTTKYYPSLPYKRCNIHLVFGWRLFCHKDGGSCDIQLYKTCKQLNLFWWRRYNTLYGMAWIAVILGIPIKSPLARKAWGSGGSST